MEGKNQLTRSEIKEIVRVFRQIGTFGYKSLTTLDHQGTQLNLLPLLKNFKKNLFFKVFSLISFRSNLLLIKIQRRSLSI